jgi:glycosyl transferase family 25
MSFEPNPFRNGQIDAVYVIHARKFTDRAAHIAVQMALFDIPYELVQEHDADEIEPALKKRFMAPDYPLSINKFSCAMKHFEALRRIAARGHRRALVLEDDVVLHRNFNRKLVQILAEANNIKGLHTIQIGSGGNMFIPRNRLQSGRCLYETDQVRTNEAFLIDAETAQLRVTWLERNQIRAATDHTFNTIDRELGIRCYWSEPSIAVQGSMNGRFRSSLDNARETRPLWLVKARFLWQRARRKYLYPLFSINPAG